MTEKQKKLLDVIKTNPYKIGNQAGFQLLNNSLHNEWIHKLAFHNGHVNEQGHRGSYKTTCLAIAIALLLVLAPNKKIGFFRKTDTAVKEIVMQVKKILISEIFRYIVKEIYGCSLSFVVSNSTQITTNLCTDNRGAAQLIALGIHGAITGKHFDIIFLDDIITLEDRFSKAERDATRIAVQEICGNLLNRGGYIKHTGTPWHENDAWDLFQAYAPINRNDCYSTGLITNEQLNVLRTNMTPSLFSANYELQHIASEDAIFTTNRPLEDCKDKLVNGVTHVDCAYGGTDRNAITISNFDYKTGTIYIYGFMKKGHISDHVSTIIDVSKSYDTQKAFMEDNADKGFARTEFYKLGFPATGYHEKENKNQKIRQFGYLHWDRIIFHNLTDPEYIKEIMDYNDQAEHDDAPDSLATSCRYWHKVIIKWEKEKEKERKKNAV